MSEASDGILMSHERKKRGLLEFLTITTYYVRIPICISIFNVRDMAHVRTDDLNDALLNDVSSSAVRPFRFLLNV